MLTSLKPAIRRSLPNAKELERLLPEILDSRDTHTHLETILEDCATGGYVESYKVVAPEIFMSPKLYRFAIRHALESAIEGGHSAIAEHMLEEIHQFPTSYSSRRRNLIIKGLELALGTPNWPIAKLILQTYVPKEEIRHSSLSTSLEEACRMNQGEAVSLLVDYAIRARDAQAANVPGGPTRAELRILTVDDSLEVDWQ
jgi:hypothetical protein